VDSRKARQAITNARSYWESYYWLDIGNNADTGQFVLGQPENRNNQKAGGRLPTIAELFPEIINPKLDKNDKLPSCSAIEALERQEPFVNQVLANHSLAMLARLFRYGRLSYHGGFVNVATGRVNSLPVRSGVRSPETGTAVARWWPDSEMRNRERTLGSIVLKAGSQFLQFQDREHNVRYGQE
jgi:PRTRC genetic system ThiF family protein